MDEFTGHIDAELDRIGNAGLLTVWACESCEADVEVDARDAGGLPIAVGVRHRVGCPDWLPEWPA